MKCLHCEVKSFVFNFNLILKVFRKPTKKHGQIIHVHESTWKFKYFPS